MIKRMRILGVFLLVLSLGPVWAMELEPIPDGADLVFFVNNHSGLPLLDLLNAAPVPAQPRQKMEEFFTATGFNPFRDISRAQLMVKKGATKREDNAVIVLTGSFNKDMILGFIKTKLGQTINEEKIGDFTLSLSPDGKGGVCFLDSSKVAFGTTAALQVFVEAKGGVRISTEFDELKSLVHDKAYAALLVGGKEFLRGEMNKNREKRKARFENRPRRPNPIGPWLETYLSEGVEPLGIFAQVLDQRIEAKILYRRGETKTNSVQASVEINDPKVTIENLFREFLKVLPEFDTPKPLPPQEQKTPKKGW
jgi:hypothetical protein